MSPLLVFSVIFSVKLLDLNVFLVCVLAIFSFFSQMIVLSSLCPLAFFFSLLVQGLGFCCHVGGNYGSFRVFRVWHLLDIRGNVINIQNLDISAPFLLCGSSKLSSAKVFLSSSDKKWLCIDDNEKAFILNTNMISRITFYHKYDTHYYSEHFL